MGRKTRRAVGWCLATWAATLTGGCPPPPAGAPVAGDGDVVAGDGAVIADELIVIVRPGADNTELGALYDGAGVTLRERLALLSADLLQVDPNQRAAAEETLGASPLVEDVVENRHIALDVAPNDANYARQWHLAVIEAPAAWSGTQGSAEVLVAVLDTGVDGQHPDLASKLVPGGNTYDGTSGWQDEAGHGTAVAGIIGAAADNDVGVASVAWACPLMPIRVTGADGRASTWSLVAGIALASQAGARVINVSFQPVGTFDELVLRQAELARVAGALVVFPTGNSGEESALPASDAALFVGAVDAGGARAAFSTYGALVDLVAPGVGIYTTQRGGGYAAWTGTSFAAPLVSGVAALVWSANPALRPATVEGILLATATDLGAEGDDAQFGAGRVNARAAVALARATQEQSDAVPPVVTIQQPAAGATVSGATVVAAQAADDSDLADVALWLDGQALATDAVRPYEFVINAGRYAPGQHELRVIATDVYGNAGEARCSVRFAAPADRSVPTIELVSPQDGSVVSGLITIMARARDDRALARAEVRVDGRLIATLALAATQADVAYNWDTGAADVAAGEHTLALRVVDTSENAASAAVRVTVSKWSAGK